MPVTTPGRLAPLPTRAGLAVAALCAVVACGNGSTTGTKEPCTLIGAPKGVSVTIAERHAADVSTATMTVCWDGSCKEPDIRLHTSTSPGPAQCDDGVCVSRASPTGDLNGFADVEDLPTKPVEVRLVLFDTNGSELMDDRVTVTPSMKRPNGDHCPPGGPNAGVSVEDGALRKPD